MRIAMSRWPVGGYCLALILGCAGLDTSGGSEGTDGEAEPELDCYDQGYDDAGCSDDPSGFVDSTYEDCGFDYLDGYCTCNQKAGYDYADCVEALQ